MMLLKFPEGPKMCLVHSIGPLDELQPAIGKVLHEAVDGSYTLGLFGSSPFSSSVHNQLRSVVYRAVVAQVRGAVHRQLIKYKF